MGDVTVEIDGNDVSQYAVEGSWTRRLNRPSTATVKVSMQNSVGGAGSVLKITNNAGGGTLVFHGRVLLCETDTGEDTGYTVYNASDPMELWQYRPARGGAAPCSFMPKVGESVIDQYITGPQILEAMLHNSDGSGDCGTYADCEDADAEFCEGPLFLTYGTFEGGGANLTGAPTDWPMTIAEITSLMISTGCLDVVINPTDPGGGIMGEVSAYNGDYGTDLSGSVIFQYGMGAFNVSRLRWNEDLSTVSNKLWYFSGPRCGTVDDPEGEQHWCFNVQGDDPGMIALDPIPNGASVATLLANRLTSRANLGTRMDIQIFDAFDDDCCGSAVGTPGRDMYRRRWQTESWIRNFPRELIHITPTRETEIGSFDIGDIVGVQATAAVRGGFTGAQRVYEYTTSWDNDGVLALSELQTSDTADQ